MTRKAWKGSAPLKPSFSNKRAQTMKSGNWSGYALMNSKRNSFRSISAFWIVPKVQPSRRSTYSSAWIGIDGLNNSALIQTGTEQDFENGKPLYYPWWEILPAPETIIPYPVRPKDRIFAKISKGKGNTWSILLKNITRRWTFKKTTSYTGPATSAEWILEAPSIGGITTQLANYTKMAFKTSRVNSRNPLFTPNNRIIMIQNGRAVSTPSFPNKKRDGFSVAYGSKLPGPPKQQCKRKTRPRYPRP